MKYILNYITKNGPTVLALGVCIGLLAPRLAEIARPLMPVTVFVFVLGTLLRIDNKQIIESAKEIKISIIFPIFMVVICPYLFGGISLLLGASKELTLAIALAIAAPPASGNSAVARMLGLNPSMSLVSTLCSMALIPLTAPMILNQFGSGVGLSIDPLDLAWRLALLIGGAEGVAILIRRFAFTVVQEHGLAIDGLVVVSLLIFACGTMFGMFDILVATPALALKTIAIAYLLNITMLIICSTLYPGDLNSKLTMGLNCGNRNVGLIWSALGLTISPSIALFFACSQLPIYTIPKILQHCLPLLKNLGIKFKKRETL